MRPKRLERELLARLLHVVWAEEGGYGHWDDLQDWERDQWRERAKRLGLWMVVRSDLHNATREYVSTQVPRSAADIAQVSSLVSREATASGSEGSEGVSPSSP